MPAASAASAPEVRHFCRFGSGPASGGYSPLPPDGLCLSAFLLLSRPGRPGEVLVGRIDPTGPWERIGGLTPDRVRSSEGGWMLPSSHLLYFEAPEEALRRIAREQLGIDALGIGPIEVRSETYASRLHPERRRHWDLDFLARGEAPPAFSGRHPAWKELAFIDPRATGRSAFARSHDEILELAGHRFD